MSEPISVRTEAINTLRTLLGQSTGSEGDVALDELSNELSSTNTTTNTLANSIVSLKNSVALLKAQMELINETVKADLSTVEIKDPDAPTQEEQTGSGSTIKYTVEKGTIEIDYFYDDETHYIKHYTYDNLHVITYCLKLKKAVFSSSTLQTYKVATFTDLSSVPDSGTCMGIFKYKSWFSIENNNIFLNFGRGEQLNKDVCESGYFYWFDRNSSSKMFTFEDGYLVSANVATASPFYATHAYVGNLHFLTIHTKAVQELTNGQEFKIAEFPNILSMPNANLMGHFVRHNGLWCHTGIVKASDNRTISIKGSDAVAFHTNSFIALNLIWIDTKAVTNDTAISNATSTDFTSTDKYAKYLKYGRFNVVQAYGSSNGLASNTIASFADPVVTPDAENVGVLYGQPTSSSNYQAGAQPVTKLDVRTFNGSCGLDGYHLYTYLWFA